LLPSISDVELKICYLKKINIPPGKISSILNISIQAVSMARSRMYEKITKKKGTTAKFDNLISEI
jgi:DNA-binding CsgD family transcriptional regulator